MKKIELDKLKLFSYFSHTCNCQSHQRWEFQRGIPEHIFLIAAFQGVLSATTANPDKCCGSWDPVPTLGLSPTGMPGPVATLAAKMPPTLPGNWATAHRNTHPEPEPRMPKPFYLYLFLLPLFLCRCLRFLGRFKVTRRLF